MRESQAAAGVEGDGDDMRQTGETAPESPVLKAWVPDSETNNCSNCAVGFGWFTRKVRVDITDG